MADSFVRTETVPTYTWRTLNNHPRLTPTNNLISDGVLKDNGIFMIGGPPKTYKSFAVNTIAANLCTASPMFNAYRRLHGRSSSAFIIPKPQRVLLLEQEVGAEDLEDRIKPLWSALPPDKQELFNDNFASHSLDHSLQLDDDKGVIEIGKIIAQIKPTVVIFDPLIEFHTSNENDTQSMAKVMRAIDGLREHYHFACIMNHHEGKNNSQFPKEGGDRLRGSSALFGKCDALGLLGWHNVAARIIKMDFTLRRGKPLTSMFLQLNEQTLAMEFVCWDTKESRKAANLPKRARQSDEDMGDINEVIKDMKVQ